MRDPYWHDETTTLYAGDAREVLAEMPDQAVDCIVTAAPRWTPERTPVPGHQALSSYGNEPTPSLYVAALRRVLAHARRVLTDTGTCWLITSDRYVGKDEPIASPSGRHARRLPDHAMTGLPATSLIGLPWQIAFVLLDDGWILRNAIILRHCGVDTERVTDRFPVTYKLIFLLVKQRRYHFDLNPLQEALHRPEAAADPPAAGGRQEAASWLGAITRRRGKRHTRRQGGGKDGTAAMLSTERHAAAHPAGGNPGDVWNLPAALSSAVPPDVPLRCIAAGCRPDGTVLDLFPGTASTGMAARQLGRSFIGIEPDASACELTKARLFQRQGEETQ